MINDCHVHIGYSADIERNYTFNNLVEWRKQFPYINKVLVMGTATEPNNGLIKELTGKHDWLYGLYWWRNNKEEIRLNGKMLGIKYHGAYTGKPVTDLPEDVLKFLNFNRILLVHCGRYLEGDIKSNTSYLHALEVAHHYPKIKVILAHMGGTDTTVCKKAIEHGYKYHNIYFDTSGITTPYIIEYALKKLPSTRILFGSDLPWCSFPAMVWTVADANCSRLDKDDIFEHNFELLLK